MFLTNSNRVLDWLYDSSKIISKQIKIHKFIGKNYHKNVWEFIEFNKKQQKIYLGFNVIFGNLSVKIRLWHGEIKWYEEM